MSATVETLVERLFDMVDLNEDGLITRVELRTALKGILNRGDSEHFMREMDFNKDGCISREECRLYLASQLDK